MVGRQPAKGTREGGTTWEASVRRHVGRELEGQMLCSKVAKLPLKSAGGHWLPRSGIVGK